MYRAADTRMGREVALKIISAELGEQSSRLRREARAISKLDHPNIVKVFDIARDGEVEFIVMELIDGRPLQALIAEGPIAPEACRAFTAQVAAALACAHEAGVVHRDLKPANVMITTSGAVKLLDFGIAKIDRSRIPDITTASDTYTGTLAGTAAYMSPEQLRGTGVDGRSDIFALGVVLYEMLAHGRRPFTGQTHAELTAAILYRDPEPLRGVPRALERIALRCLRKDPELRFASAQAVAQALEDSSRASALTGPRREPVIAVLPFANLNAQPENDYFSDGLAEEIILALQRLPGIRVIARSSSFQFRDRENGAADAGRRLGADYVVDGSVRWHGSRVRVSAEMLPVPGEFPVWSDRWDAEMTGAFTIQDEIASAIAAKLRGGGLIAAEPEGARRHSLDPEACAAYLRARHIGAQLSPAGIARAQEYLASAIALDPGYALAYTGSAYLTFYGILLGVLRPTEHVEHAASLVRRALAIDPNLAGAHAIEGVLAGMFRYDWAESERHFHLAFDQDDGSAELHYLFGRWHLWPRQRWERAAHHLEISSQLDPLSPLPHFALAETFYCQDRFGEAMARIEAALELSPGFWMPHMLGGQVMLAQQRVAEARHWFRRMADLIPGHPWIGVMEIAALAAEGKLAAARAAANKMLRSQVPVRPGDWAGIHLDLGEVDAALFDLEQCIEEKDWLVFWMLGAGPRRRQFANPVQLREIVSKLNLDSGPAISGSPAAGL